MGYDLPDDYVDVAARIREFRDKHPEGSLQQHSLDFRTFAGKEWVVFTATAFRTPDDCRPGMGTAWEQVPGKTPFTRDSELQNAETAAWGRAIVAVLAADTKKVASADEVRNRQADREAPEPTLMESLLTRIAEAETIAALDDLQQKAHARGMLPQTPAGSTLPVQSTIDARREQIGRAS